MTESTCPCEDCICLGICRHKYYFELINQCCFVLEYLMEEPDFSRKWELEDILKPSRWETKKDHMGDYINNEKDRDETNHGTM